MPESLEDFLMTRPPTADRPLLGQTVLVVEDSRFTCEALRMICQRSGARIRRADCLRSAERHLQTYRPGIVVIDVGLPDGSGLDLIRRLAQAEPPIGVIVATSGDDTFARAAVEAGANVFISKPITSVSAFQSAILAELPKHARPAEYHPAKIDEVVPDRIALRDDLSLAAELLGHDPDQVTCDYLSMFLLGLAKTSDDPDLADAARGLANAEGAPGIVESARRIVSRRIALEQQV